jgi:hypothetical protein
VLVLPATEKHIEGIRNKGPETQEMLSIIDDEITKTKRIQVKERFDIIVPHQIKEDDKKDKI